MTDETANTQTDDAAPADAPADASLMAAAPVDAPAAPAKPEGLPDDYWDAEAGAVKPEAYAKLAELQAAAAAQREGVPETADGYELKLDEEILGLDGKPVEFSADDPLAKAILPALHEAGLPQAQVSKILSAYAKAEIEAVKAESEAATAMRAEQIKKLGDSEDAVKTRTGAVHGQLVGALGAERAEALRQVLVGPQAADAFLALEALVSKLQPPTMSAAPLQPAAPKSLADRLYPNPSVN